MKAEDKHHKHFLRLRKGRKWLQVDLVGLYSELFKISKSEVRRLFKQGACDFFYHTE